MRFGTDPHTLARRKDPETSHAAARAVKTATWERRVYIAISMHGAKGATQDQVIDKIQDRFGRIPYSTITARFKALEDKKLIFYTGEKRKGKSGRESRVRIAKKFYRGDG